MVGLLRMTGGAEAGRMRGGSCSRFTRRHCGRTNATDRAKQTQIGSGGAAAIHVDKFPSARATPPRVFQSHLCTCKKATQPLPLRRHTHRTQQSRIPAARTPQAADGCRSIPQGQMRRLCRGLLPLQAEIQATLCNRSRPDSSRDTHRNGARGGPGESHAHLAFPRRLSAAFDARKRPPRNNTHPAATEWKHAQPPFTGMQNNAAPPTS